MHPGRTLTVLTMMMTEKAKKKKKKTLGRRVIRKE
jgi:hypothetical protein